MLQYLYYSTRPPYWFTIITLFAPFHKAAILVKNYLYWRARFPVLSHLLHRLLHLGSCQGTGHAVHRLETEYINEVTESLQFYSKNTTIYRSRSPIYLSHSKLKYTHHRHNETDI